jgi:hypothetical protein
MGYTTEFDGNVSISPHTGTAPDAKRGCGAVIAPQPSSRRDL